MLKHFTFREIRNGEMIPVGLGIYRRNLLTRTAMACPIWLLPLMRTREWVKDTWWTFLSKINPTHRDKVFTDGEQAGFAAGIKAGADDGFRQAMRRIRAVEATHRLEVSEAGVEVFSCEYFKIIQRQTQEWNDYLRTAKFEDSK